MTVRVTEHAIDRYCERIANLPRERVRAIIMGASRGIEAAALMGAQVVRLSTGARLIVANNVVITVVRTDTGFPRALRRSVDEY